MPLPVSPLIGKEVSTEVWMHGSLLSLWYLLVAVSTRLISYSPISDIVTYSEILLDLTSKAYSEDL